jgi:acetyl-CoA C-acetyltransferase
VRDRLGSVGRPLPGIEFQIRTESGDAAAPGETGLVFVRGEQISGEYGGGSAPVKGESAEGMGRRAGGGGWFATRDLGRLDSDGYLYIEGRADDTIIRGGENIAPAGIEDVLLGHPAITEVAVVGVPDPEWGQRLAAVVVGDGDPDEIRRWAKDRLRSSKTPDLIVFRDELPRTETGKLLRRVLLAELSANWRPLMPEAVIVSALRTPIGTAIKGSLREVTAFDLADHMVRAVASGIDPALIDDVILAESMYGGGVIARHAAVTAGLTEVPGLSNNRHCAAGAAAVQSAAASVRAGMDELVIAGGVNSASTSPKSRFRSGSGDNWIDPWTSPTHPDRPDAPNMDMSITVGWNAAVRAGVSREEMDEWALRSHRNAISAIDEGRFDWEVVPVKTAHGLFSVDEHPRRNTSMEKLAPLHPEIEGFSITAGNASGSNDGAAAVVVASDRMASDRLGLPALATVRSWASVGVDPAETGLAPVRAIPKALGRAGLSLGDVDLFEINEAFAAMCVATVRLLDIDPDLVNVSGSGCSLGHPVAATGARMVVTLIHELRRRGGGTGVAAMCAGGGMGSATVIEVAV